MHDNQLTIADDCTTLPPRARLAAAVLVLVGLGAVGLGALLGVRESDHFSRFLHSYLVSYAYVLSIALGALFFVVVQHASRAGWSVTVRRLAEILAATLPFLAILFAPILASALLGSTSLFPWVDAAALRDDPQLRHKAAYLNVSFFTIRAAAYFLIWGLLGVYFLRRSRTQDRGADDRLTLEMERVSPAALLLFALTVTFAAFDWLMSLDPRWFSTIYGLLYFAGAVVGGLAAIIIMAILLQSDGRLQRAITVEHYHDLGKYLFAFIVFWAYIAFSQYLLIWYANVPEETVWYKVRASDSWGRGALFLLAAHLLLPFLGLLSRHVKRRRWALGFWAAWLLFVHWIDLYWLIMPVCHPTAAQPGLIDACCAVGLVSQFVGAALFVAAGGELAPKCDPRLKEALAFENA